VPKLANQVPLVDEDAQQSRMISTIAKSSPQLCGPQHGVRAVLQHGLREANLGISQVLGDLFGWAGFGVQSGQSSDPLQLQGGRQNGADTIESTTLLQALWIHLSDIYGDASTPNLIDAATTIALNHRLREQRLEISEITATFATLISANIGGLAASKAIAGGASPRVRTTAVAAVFVCGRKENGPRIDPEIDADVNRAFKTLPEADPHSGASGSSKSQIRSGVGVKVPASKKGKPRMCWKSVLGGGGSSFSFLLRGNSWRSTI